MHGDGFPEPYGRVLVHRHGFETGAAVEDTLPRVWRQHHGGRSHVPRRIARRVPAPSASWSWFPRRRIPTLLEQDAARTLLVAGGVDQRRQLRPRRREDGQRAQSILPGAEHRPAGSGVPDARPQRHSRRARWRRQRRCQRDATSWWPRRATAACASSSRRCARRGPAATAPSARSSSTTTTTACERSRPAKARCWSMSTPACCPTCNRYIGVDGLHPNEAGYAKIADIFFQAIQANFEVR